MSFFDDDAVAGFGFAEIECGRIGGSPLGDDAVFDADAVTRTIHIATGAELNDKYDEEQREYRNQQLAEEDEYWSHKYEDRFDNY